MKSSIDVPKPPEPNVPSAPHHPLEPVRLLAGGGNALERRLLASAAADQMPHASIERLQRALMVVETSPRAGSFAHWLGRSGFVKYGSFIGLGALAVLGTWAARDRLPAAPPALATPLARTPAHATPATAARADTTLPLPSAPLPNVRDEFESAPARALHADAANPRATSVPHTPAARTPAPRATAVGGSLREELRLLEAAQTALRAGRVNDAQRALEQHTQRFTGGELALEAEVLGIEMSLAKGDRQQARERARRLLARPEAGRYRPRLEALERAQTDSAARSGGANPRLEHMNERRLSR